MKILFAASIIMLMPVLGKAQQAAAGTDNLSESMASYNANSIKVLRKTERERVQLSKAKKAFAQDFENASDVRWTSGKHSFAVGFTKDAVKTIAWYNKNGKLLHTLISYSAHRMPAPVRAVIENDFRGYSITHVNELREGDTVVYLVHLENAKTISLVTVYEGAATVYRNYRKA